jgi:hypothetical protein
MREDNLSWTAPRLGSKTIESRSSRKRWRLHRRSRLSITMRYRGDARKGGKLFAQIRQEWIGALLPARPRTIGRRLQTARDIFADRLTVDAELTGNGRYLQALPMKLQIMMIPEFDQRAPPSRHGEKHRQEFKAHKWGRLTGRADRSSARRRCDL